MSTSTLTDPLELDVVVGLAEPCATFRADDDSASPVCRHCGWLDDEHPRAATPRRGARVRVARRRAVAAAG